MNILFVGGGNMATALIAGLSNMGVNTRQFGVVEPKASAREVFQTNWQVAVWPELVPEALAEAEIVVLAVKPQQLQGVAQLMAPWLRHQLVLSIAAGIHSVTLTGWLNGYTRVVRAMPNTPAMIGAGVTGLYAGAAVSAEQRTLAERIMQAAGSVFWLANEAQMDAVTAVSGSGPAYVFYFMEAMERAAVALGLSVELARALTQQTFLGASQLAMQSGEDVGRLRERVTSPGGTTASALDSFQVDGVADGIVRGVEVAAARSVELGRLLAG